MKVTINHKTLELPADSSLQAALDAKGIAPQGIATALNGKVVAAKFRATTTLAEGDDIVVIKAFYGG